MFRCRSFAAQGSAEALVWAAEATAKGEGFGKELGLGSKQLCEKYGKPELSMTVKGQEFPAYDPRGIQGMGLAYATSNRGACHLRGYTVSSEILGVPEKTDPLSTDGHNDHGGERDQRRFGRSAGRREDEGFGEVQPWTPWLRLRITAK